MALNSLDVVCSRTRDELFVVFQSDFLAQLDTRLVIPLIPISLYRSTTVIRLTPVLSVDGEPHVLATHLCFSARNSDLRPTGITVADEHDKIREAFEFLTTGF